MLCTVKWYVPLGIAIVALGTARAAREVASERQDEVSRPYAPSPEAAPIVAGDYRELAADLLFVRLIGTFGSPENRADDLAALAEAIAALDPGFRRIYDIGPIAISAAKTGVDQPARFRALALLDAGMKQFPDDWKLPNIAGQIYLVDLETTDPKQRHEWDEKGTLLLESASRKPHAPAEAAMTAAMLQTKFGQHERAASSLRELLLITSDDKARGRIVEQLAKLEGENHDEIAAELLAARKQFDHEWKSVRPAVPATFYVLLGAPLGPRFDLEDLAIGGRPPIAEPIERLEPRE